MRLRVVAYNVRNFRDDRPALLAVVRSLAPDVLLLNETGARWRLRAFASRLEMRAATDPWSPLRRRVKDAVLARPPWRILGHHQRRFTRSARFFPRGALIATLERDGGRLTAVSIHLGLRAAERRRHVEELLSEFGTIETPIVLGGDANERPDGVALARLRERLLEATDRVGGTFPSRDPVARIDHVFVSPGVRVLAASVADGHDVERASDHRPVVVDLELPG